MAQAEVPALVAVPAPAKVGARKQSPVAVAEAQGERGDSQAASASEVATTT